MASTAFLARGTAAATVVLLAVTVAGPPPAAYAVAGPTDTQGQGLRATIAPAGDPAPLTFAAPAATWTTGGAAVTRDTAGVHLGLPVLAPSVLDTGAITAQARPATGGGRASAEVLGLGVLGPSTLGADAIGSHCSATATAITGGTDVAGLTVAGDTVNPGVNTDISVRNVLSGQVDRQTAGWDRNTGRLTYTVRGLTVKLLGGLGVAAGGGTITVAESVCSGIVKLGPPATSPRSAGPGDSVTPRVTVRNTGSIAAPNTVITIPAPPDGYTLGPPTVTGGGECTSTRTRIRCSGVTVPGGGRVVVSLPVTVNGSAPDAADWAPGPAAILARSTPVAAVAAITVDVSGGGTLISMPARRTAPQRAAVRPPAAAATGGYPAAVTPDPVRTSTTSPERGTVGNAAAAQLAVATTSDVTPSPIATPTFFRPPNDNGNNPRYSADDNLPQTGSPVFSLMVLAVLLIAIGAAIRLLARNRPRPQPGGAP